MTSLPASDRLGPIIPSNCEREPIHIPEAIQPDGVLLACEGPENRITHASANCATLLGIGPESVLGRRLSEVLGTEAAEAILLATESERYAPNNVLSLKPPGRDGPPCDVLAHEIRGRVVVEMEPGCEGGRGEDPLPQVQALVQALRRAGNLEQLCELADRELKRLTKNDRCMVYRFDPDGHGQVVAEAREADQEPYLHLRYPASDIPTQARRLYLQQRVRAIADVNYVPVPLLAAHAGEGPLDMNFCGLRSVSPLHLQYLRNMGVTATLAVSLIQDKSLWGMLVCYSRTPRRPSARLRALADLVGQVMSLLRRQERG